jgi:RluA family pseudouridine synthase
VGPDGAPALRRPPDRITVDADNAGRRLDSLVRKLLPGTPLGTVMKWIRRGTVRVNGRRADLDLRVALGDVVSVPAGLLTGTPAPEPPRRRAVSLDVLYEDDWLLVVSKPAGLAAHAGTGHEDDSLMARVVDYLGAAQAAPGHRPGLVQRLDEGVSGVLVVGKSARALRTLTAAVEQDRLDKRYLALVVGEVERAGSIELPLAIEDQPRRDRPRTRVDEAGLAARTDYQVRERFDGATLLELRIHTGRQHQIRAHLQAIGHPIVGDPRYGPPVPPAFARSLRRPFLHACTVTLEHPEDGRRLTFAAPLPAELAAVVALLSPRL